MGGTTTTKPQNTMEVAPKTLEPLPNGVTKKPFYSQHHHEQQQQQLYRECMKNHAAGVGGYAVDGCGEFMQSPSTDPAVPSSITCAACGCHRNFHRRVLQASADSPEAPGDGRSSGSPPAKPPYGSSATHMLMALSSGLPPMPRKRFRTKFSSVQKERMHELSERLGWRMQKRDESFIEDSCKEIGVTKGVFKVWMHNNKHALAAHSRKGGRGAGGAGGGGGGGDSHPANGSSTSS